MQTGTFLDTHTQTQTQLQAQTNIHIHTRTLTQTHRHTEKHTFTQTTHIHIQLKATTGKPSAGRCAKHPPFFVAAKSSGNLMLFCKTRLHADVQKASLRHTQTQSTSTHILFHIYTHMRTHTNKYTCAHDQQQTYCLYTSFYLDGTFKFV